MSNTVYALLKVGVLLLVIACVLWAVLFLFSVALFGLDLGDYGYSELATGGETYRIPTVICIGLTLVPGFASILLGLKIRSSAKG